MDNLMAIIGTIGVVIMIGVALSIVAVILVFLYAMVKAIA